MVDRPAFLCGPMVIEVKHVLAYDVDRRTNKPLCQTADEETVYTWLSATKDVNCPECLQTIPGR